MLLIPMMISNRKGSSNAIEEERDGMVIAKFIYTALNHLFRKPCNPALVTVVLVFICRPAWGYVPDFGQEEKPVFLPANFQHPRSGYQLISKNKKKKKPKNARSRSSRENDRLREMSPEEKEAIKKKYKEWQSLPPEKQRIMRQRMDELKKMPPQKRELYKQMFQQWQNLSPGERRQLQKDLKNWEQLSPQQKNSIRRRFKR